MKDIAKGSKKATHMDTDKTLGILKLYVDKYRGNGHESIFKSLGKKAQQGEIVEAAYVSSQPDHSKSGHKRPSAETAEISMRI